MINKLLMLMLLFALIGMACVPASDPIVIVITVIPTQEVWVTPTQEVVTSDRPCENLPPIAWPIINENPCMQDPVFVPYQPIPYGTITEQTRPYGYTLTNTLKTIDGLGRLEDHVAAAPIRYEDNSYVFDLSAIAGEWGYTTEVTVNAPGCLAIKSTGRFSIHDSLYSERYYNYGLHTIVKRQNGAEVDLRRTEFAAYSYSGKFDIFRVVKVETPGHFSITNAVFAAYSSALPGSWAAWETFSVSIAPDGYCEEEGVFSVG